MSHNYSSLFKLKVIRYCLSASGGVSRTSKHFSVSQTTIQSWLLLYKSKGKSGLRSSFDCRHYSDTFKEEVIAHKRKHHLSAPATSEHFGVCIRRIWAWEKEYQHGHSKVLADKKARGKPMIQKKSSKLDSEKSQKELIEEIKYLRTEVAYLKKLQALIQEEELASRDRKPKSLKN